MFRTPIFQHFIGRGQKCKRFFNINFKFLLNCFPGHLPRPLVLDVVVFLDERVELVLADVTTLAPAVVGRVELLVAVGEVVKAGVEFVAESKKLFGVVGQFAGCDVLEALRAAAFEPNAAGRNKKRQVKGDIDEFPSSLSSGLSVTCWVNFGHILHFLASGPQPSSPDDDNRYITGSIELKT